MPDTYTRNLERLQSMASKNGLMLNPDPERVKKVVGLMADNYDAVGEWICPCKQQHKPPERGKDKTCPCPEWLEEIERDGQCYCRLFFTPEKARRMA
jgi:ferredoxin-thioredoxin reductase catalytic subunit